MKFFQNKKLADGVVVDTSGLVDERFLTLQQTGFLPKPIIIPSFVIDELQQLADGSTGGRRRMFKRTMELVAKLVADNANAVQLFQSNSTHDVDASLQAFALKYRMALYSVDHNLLLAARTRSIQTLSPNELMMGLKTKYEVGDEVSVFTLEKGTNKAIDAEGIFIFLSTKTKDEESASRIAVITNVKVEASGILYFAKLRSGKGN